MEYLNRKNKTPPQSNCLCLKMRLPYYVNLRLVPLLSNILGEFLAPSVGANSEVQAYSITCLSQSNNTSAEKLLTGKIMVYPQNKNVQSISILCMNN